MTRPLKSVPPDVCAACRRAFCFPDPARARWLQDGALGVVELPPEAFGCRRDVGYEFETAAVEVEAGPRLFFVRIDSFDPKARAGSAPGELDYCIPIACDGATPRERLTWTIPFGGAWSDTREAALLVFDERWTDWLARVTHRIAFANPGAASAALFRLQDRDRGTLDACLA